eukprot:s3315_g1.t1
MFELLKGLAVKRGRSVSSVTFLMTGCQTLLVQKVYMPDPNSRANVIAKVRRLLPTDHSGLLIIADTAAWHDLRKSGRLMPGPSNIWAADMVLLSPVPEAAVEELALMAADMVLLSPVPEAAVEELALMVLLVLAGCTDSTDLVAVDTKIFDVKLVFAV